MKSGVGKKGSVFSKLVVTLLVLLILSTPPLAGSDSWSMFFHNPQHTGNTTSSSPNTNDTLWTRPMIGGNGYSSPTVTNGRIFVNKAGYGILYCLYETNGTEIWNKSIGISGYACSTPAIADGKLFVVGDRVYCFYENNGTKAWNKSVSGGVGTSSPTVVDGRLFVNTGTLYCFYANNGTEIWNKTIGGSCYSTPAAANGKVFVNGEKLFCLYANNGTEIWNVTSNQYYNSPVIVDGRVFFNPSQIMCLYENNGTEIWRRTYGGDGCSSPAVAYGKVFVNAGGGIFCYCENNGTEIWNVAIGGYGCSTPAVSNDDKVFINAGEYTFCLNKNDGELIWKKRTGGEGLSSPAIANGRVFVNQGTVYCFGSPLLKIDHIVIEDEAHNELTTVYLNASESTTFFAAGYNSSTSTFVKYIEVNWTESKGLGSIVPPKGISTTFTLGKNFGFTIVKGENIALGLSDDFVIEVIPSTVLKQGWDLISIPLIQNKQTLTKVFDSIDGWYDAVQWYDNTDVKDPWKHLKVGKPYGNDLFEINETMGFWIHITQPGDTIFLYNGTQPTQNQTIQLYEGWNMVGYPSLTNYNRTEGLNNLTFGTEVDSIWTFNAATQKWRDLGPSDYFEPCKGYWIHAKTKCEWEVPL